MKKITGKLINMLNIHPKPTITRLFLYKCQLEEIRQRGIKNIYSQTLADQLGLTAAIVRKDLSTIGSFGNVNLG